jgi:hypothetical protein
MIVALIGLAVLALVVFAFVLEPVLRGRADQVVLDAVAEPRPVEQLIADEPVEVEPDDARGGREQPRSQRTVDRPVAGDVA